MREILLFELQYRFKRPATWIYAFLGMMIAGLWAGLMQSSTAEYTNSPNHIAEVIGAVSLFSLFFYAAIMGVPIYRDQDHKTSQTYFTFPISEKSYVLGRFLGSYTIASLVNLFILIGTLVGFFFAAYLERPDYGEYTQVSLSSYLLPFFFFLQVNAFFIGTLFFCLMAFFKKMPIIYLGGILLFVLYQIAGNVLSDLDNQWLSVYLDPFGNRAFSFVKKYWSINELNTQSLPLNGKFMINRIIWSSLGFIFLGITIWKFDFKKFLISRKKGGKVDLTPYTESFTSKIQQVFDRKIEKSNLWSLTKIEFLSIVKDPIFMILIIIGIIISMIVVYNNNETYGTPNQPLTRFMVTYISAGTTLLSVIILIIYSGEAVHRTKKNKTFVFYDALPISNHSLYFSKIISLIGVAIILTIVNILVGFLFQTINGYFRYEWNTYIIYCFLILLPGLLTTIFLSFFVHVLVNNKFLGHFVVIVLYVGLPLLVSLGFKSSNPLYIFGGVTPFFISDLNDFGHYLAGLNWLNLYWLLFTTIFMLIGQVFWNRGFFATAKERLSIAKKRITTTKTVIFVITLLLFISTGSYIHYNISVLNEIKSGSEINKIQADAEKTYSKYINQPHPQATDLKVAIDVYPKSRSFKAKGVFELTNNYATIIDTLLLNVQYPSQHYQIDKVIYNNHQLHPVISDSVNRMYFYKLPNSLSPSEKVSLTLEVSTTTKGFSNDLDQQVLYNGTFLNNNIFPSFSYDRTLTDNGIRKKHGLDKLDYLFPPRTDSTAIRKNLFNEDANYINFEATISTQKDQIAIAPGQLIKQWNDNERAYFHYKLESKTDLFFNIISAKYDVEKSNWTAPSGKSVAIEVYHSPKHKRNLSHFIEGTKVALEYCSKNFYEYPNSVIRIVEFPAYATFAQSFATTIPYSEDFGFVANFDKAEDFNYAFRVTAHEVAHQWWGHLVTPSKTSGANIISETLAEYTSLMTMKHRYGENGIKNFLKYSLDTYLRQRAFSFKPERSLINVEVGQHIWYRKGSMIMYELQDVIGENRINSALKDFVMKYKNFESGVYPTSENLYDAIYEVSPDSLKYMVTDGFKEIVLYENRVLKAQTKKLDNGNYSTTFTVDSKKIYYDDKGKEKHTDKSANFIEIGLFGDDIVDEQEVPLKNPLYLKRTWLESGKNTFTVTTVQKPIKAGIDPYNKLIDRNSDDNLKSIKEE